MMIDGFSEAFHKNPSISLDIYGTGDELYIKEIESYIKARQMEQVITLKGRSPHMEEVYKHYDVFLMTSDYEGLPNALMEAMVSRLICISTDCKTGPKDLIEHGDNGFLIEVNDPRQLTQYIDRVMRMSREDREHMASKAREKVLTYCSQDASVNMLCALFR
jgi:glycosyltransferase involved in cell wall biosynthesis